MSNYAVGASPSSEQVCASPGIRSQRSDRSSGKGRRRRAVAEQRRTEQEHWDRLVHDSVEEIFVAPRPLSRRQSRRAARHLTRDDFDDCPHFDSQNDDNDLDIALAISLSLSETDGNVVGHGHANLSSSPEGGLLDMSYENLVLLENVKCTAALATVNSLNRCVFDKCNQSSTSEIVDELCTICQHEYNEGDTIMLLPCMHNFHDACSSEWLLHHSKLCPVCKLDVSES